MRKRERETEKKVDRIESKNWNLEGPVRPIYRNPHKLNK